MQQQNLINNNTAVIMGKVVSEFTFSHEVYGEGFYNFHVSAPRLSEMSDILPITISERLIEGNSLPLGTVVRVSGQMRSYNSYVESDRRNKLVLTLFVREIEILQEYELKTPNEIFLNGYICKPPIYRMTPFGREITDILLAVNRSYNKSDYIPCIAWGRNAKFAGKLKVGDNIKIWGRMQSRTYQKKLDSGETLERTAYEVSVSKLELGSAEDEPKEASEEVHD